MLGPKPPIPQEDRENLPADTQQWGPDHSLPFVAPGPQVGYFFVWAVFGAVATPLGVVLAAAEMARRSSRGPFPPQPAWCSCSPDASSSPRGSHASSDAAGTRRVAGRCCRPTTGPPGRTACAWACTCSELLGLHDGPTGHRRDGPRRHGHGGDRDHHRTARAKARDRCPRFGCHRRCGRGSQGRPRSLGSFLVA